MDYVAPQEVVEKVVESGAKKARLQTKTLLLKGFYSGTLLGFATALAFKVSDGLTGGPYALASGGIFPVGFVLISLLGMELVTGNFAIFAASTAAGRTRGAELLRNWGYVYIGNLIGSAFFGFLLVVALTEGFSHDPNSLGDKLVAVAQSKTLAYENIGLMGWVTAFTKGILCNWMVTLGTVIAFVSTSTIGKIVAIWLPIMTFFALALEHSVVNMFVIPSAMMMDAGISVPQWWLWNQIPVTLGNIVGGSLLTGLLLYFIYPRVSAQPAE